MEGRGKRGGVGKFWGRGLYENVLYFTDFTLFFIAPACGRVRYRRPIFRPSVRLSTFMSTFDIYVKVSILINYKTKQPSNLA